MSTENLRRTLGALSTFLLDVRYALRQMRKSPGFTITAVLTLALGIGAATAVYSVAYGVLIDPFPYKNIQTLGTVKICSPEWPRCFWSTYTPAQFQEIAEHTDLFTSLIASTISTVRLTGTGEPQSLRGNYITPNTFEVLGVQPMLGRATTDADVRPGAGEVALLSYRYWQAHFGGSRSVLGRTYTFNGHRRTVIGIMPPRFLWRGGDVYLPIQMTHSDEVQGQQSFALVGRLKPGVTDAQASAELIPIFDDFRRAVPRSYPENLRLGLMNFGTMYRSGLASTLYLLLGAVAVLLLIACVNVSSMLLARAVSREHDFVVRAALGAPRGRLARLAFTESLLLAMTAVPVAMVFAYAGLQATLRLIPTETIPDEAVVTLNVPVLLASLALAVLTVIVFGFAPAWHSARPRLAAALQSGVRTSGSQSQRRLLSGFVVTEIALSLALVMLAGLMVRSLLAVENVPVSFSPDHTLLLRVPLGQQRYPALDKQNRFFAELLDRVRAIPGVRTVTVDAALPFVSGYGCHVQIPGQPMDKRMAVLHAITPSYLAMSGKPMLQGHFIDAREIAAQSHEAVVTENFVQRYFNGKTVLGRGIVLSVFTDENGKPQDLPFTVVGVMKNLPLYPYSSEEPPDVFIPYTVAPIADTVIVSTALPAKNLAKPVRQAVSAVDKDQPVLDLMTFSETLDRYGYAAPRFVLALFGTFGAMALLLSLVGIYGVFSFVTLQRTKEIGIRMALGASRIQVMGMVLRQASLLALFGVLAGLPLALFAGRFAKDELVRTSQHDPWAFAVAILMLPILACVGAYLPARRAASIDPVNALRAE